MKASKQYIYEGILKGLELAGYSWKRDKDGNHKLY